MLAKVEVNSFRVLTLLITAIDAIVFFKRLEVKPLGLNPELAFVVVVRQ